MSKDAQYVVFGFGGFVAFTFVVCVIAAFVIEARG